MKKRNFSAEFKREAAQLVVDQNYTVAEAAKVMDIGLSTMTQWVRQLWDERQGKIPKASPISPEQIEIRKLKKKPQRIEIENEIFKKLPRMILHRCCRARDATSSKPFSSIPFRRAVKCRGVSPLDLQSPGRHRFPAVSIRCRRNLLTIFWWQTSFWRRYGTSGFYPVSPEGLFHQPVF